MHFFNKLLVTIFVCITSSLCSMQPQDWVIAYNSDSKKISCWPNECKKCLEKVVQLPGLKSRSELQGVSIELRSEIAEKAKITIKGSYQERKNKIDVMSLFCKKEKEYMVIEEINKNFLDHSDDENYKKALADSKEQDGFEDKWNKKKTKLNSQLEELERERDTFDLPKTKINEVHFLSLFAFGFCLCVLQYFHDVHWLIWPQRFLFGLGFSGALIVKGKRSLDIHKHFEDLEKKISNFKSCQMCEYYSDRRRKDYNKVFYGLDFSYFQNYYYVGLLSLLVGGTIVCDRLYLKYYNKALEYLNIKSYLKRVEIQKTKLLLLQNIALEEVVDFTNIFESLIEHSENHNEC